MELRYKEEKNSWIIRKVRATMGEKRLTHGDKERYSEEGKKRVGKKEKKRVGTKVDKEKESEMKKKELIKKAKLSNFRI